MTQLIKIASIVHTEGDNDKGHWHKYAITGEDKTPGNIFNPPHKEAGSLGVGDTIDAELEVKGKYVNIKSYKVTEKATANPEAKIDKPPAQSGISRDDVITQQVAFKGVIELLVAKIIDLDHPYSKRAAAYIEKHLPVGVLQEPPDEPVVKSAPLPQPPKSKSSVVEGIDGSNPLEDELAWSEIKKFLTPKYSAKEAGWGSISNILSKLADLGADTSSKKLEVSYETLNDVGKAKFLKLVKGEKNGS